ncbi:MAG: nucleoside triphosphate pyrophosphohydrolase, partial [Cyanobacteria bacterium QH_8_48_120]
MSNPQETVKHTNEAVLDALQELIAVVAQLRSPQGGC